jgi:hypothetical protein
MVHGHTRHRRHTASDTTDYGFGIMVQARREITPGRTPINPCYSALSRGKADDDPACDAAGICCGAAQISRWAQGKLERLTQLATELAEQ